MTTTTTERKEAREHAFTMLRRMLSPGSRVYYTVRTVARSGMSRTIDFYTVHDGAIVYLSGYIANALGMRRNDQGAIVRTGCGTDLGFDTVYALGHALWPNGTDKPHGTRNGKDDNTGGYALRSERL